MREFTIEEETTRQAFGKVIFDEAKKDKSVIAIGADTVKNLGFGDMANDFPQRVINVGIAEQNMMGAAAGLAAEGNRVFVGTYAPFATLRALEQFRTFIAYPHLNVKVAGGMGGFSAGNEGVTHQGLEDVNIMSMMPGTVVVVPADTVSTKIITRKLAGFTGPGYIRLGKTAFYNVFDENYQFEIGKGNLLEYGTDVTIICFGTMVSRSLQAHDLLNELGISARIIEMPCIKPFDKEMVLCAARETGAIVVAEESYKIGGLGSTLSMFLAERLPTPIRIVAVDDTFGEAGEHFCLMDKYHLSVSDIVNAAEGVVSMKKSDK